MRLLKRYIFRETALSCIGAVGMFVILLLSVNVIRDVVDWIALKRLMLSDFIKILGILIPSVISYALPLGMMTGILMVIGRMSSHNEILAMKSLGISMIEISRPIFFLASICTLLSVHINLFYAPDSISKYRQFFQKIVQEKPMRFLSTKTFNDYFPGYVIYVDEMKDGNFSNMRVWQLDDRQIIDTYIFAKSGKMTFDQSTNSFTLKLFDGNAERFSDARDSVNTKYIPQIIFFKNVDITLPAVDFLKKKGGRLKKFSHMTFSELLAAKRNLNFLKLSYKEIRQTKNLINMQISKHIANAVGILVMSLLAIPLGIKNNRSDKAMNVVLAIFLCLSYYFIMVIFSWLGDISYLKPHILIWIPNLVLAILGGILFRKASGN